MMSQPILSARSRLQRIFGSENFIVALYFVLTLTCLIGAWEGLKFIGQESDYKLEIGSIDIGLSMTRDRTMPHLTDVVSELFEPTQNGESLLIEESLVAARFTFQYAFMGFVIGTVVGLILAIIFVHSKLLSKGLMPYVVSSQTIPILALAPIVVIWAGRIFGSREWGIPAVAAYLGFYPVTIYALRGLSDVPATSLELMKSYAASNWEILWKLRFPNATPYIFTALKITAPASVVGAIIGELPSGIQDGLGGRILTYAQYYTTQSLRLWSTNFVTALLGIGFFLAVALTERLVVRWKYADSIYNRIFYGGLKFIRNTFKQRSGGHRD